MLNFFKETQLGAICLLLLSMSSVTAGASMAKAAFPLLGAAGISTLRIGFAALILMAIWRPWKHRLEKKSFGLIAIYGICLGCMNLMFYFAIERLPLGVTISIEFLGPLSVALLTSKVIYDFIWGGLCALGLYFLFSPQTSFSASIDFTGVFFALGAAFFWALYILTGRKASSVAPSGIVTTYGMIVGAGCILPVGIFQAASKLLTLSILPLAFAVAILSSAIPYSLEMHALKKLPVKNFGILMSLEPAIGALFGLLFLNEHLGLLQCAGIACIMAASCGSSYTSARAVDLPLDA